MSDVLILAGARTPFATWARGTTGKGAPGGALKDLDPFDLGAAALTGALPRAGLKPADLGHVVFGNMYPVGPHGCYGARYVSHRAGVPVEVPGSSVGFACGTGLLAVKAAAETIERGEAGIAAAVGADAVSQVPRAVFVPSFTDVSCGKHIARTAAERAAEKSLTRAEIDAWTRRSHLKAAEAAAARAEEIVPAAGASEDDAVLEDPSLERLAAARPLFDDGEPLMTHANTHAVVDGGAALILASPRAARGPALGRLVSSALVGVPPERMAYAAVPAVRRALDAARWTVPEVELWELNETFAAQALLDRAALGVPAELLNVRGGALALGHPFGATGLRLVHSLLLELRRRGRRRGCAAISVGGGLGIAVCVETV